MHFHECFLVIIIFFLFVVCSKWYNELSEKEMLCLGILH